MGLGVVFQLVKKDDFVCVCELGENKILFFSTKLVLFQEGFPGIIDTLAFENSPSILCHTVCFEVK